MYRLYGRASVCGAALPGESFLFPLRFRRNLLCGERVAPGRRRSRAPVRGGGPLGQVPGRPTPQPSSAGSNGAMNKRMGIGGIVLSLCGWAGAASAQDVVWRPTARPAELQPPAHLVELPTPSATIGRPVPIPISAPGFDSGLVQAGYHEMGAPTPVPRGVGDAADDSDAGGLFATDRAAMAVRPAAYPGEPIAVSPRPGAAATDVAPPSAAASRAGSGCADARGAGRPVCGPGVLDAALLRPRRIPPVAVQEGPGSAAGDDQRAGRQRDPRRLQRRESCSAATACPTGRTRAAGSRPACGWTIARQRRSR